MSDYQETIGKVRTALLETFASIYPWFQEPGNARAYKPANGGWSINEVLEHITVTTHFLMIIIRKGVPKALKRASVQRVLDAESNLDLLIPIGQRGAFPWNRPEHMVPVGKPPSETLKLMQEQEKECLACLGTISHGEGSLYKVRMSVNNIGHIDLYQWMYFVAQHARRHIGQMEENLTEWRSQPDQARSADRV